MLYDNLEVFSMNNMYSNLSIFDYGLSGIDENWIPIMNSVCFADRIYYIIEEGAGYIIDGKKHPFRKNHLYVLSHTLKLSYYVENGNFFHAYITYNNHLSPKYSDVIDIDLDTPSMLRSDVKTFLHFFDDKSLTCFHCIATTAAFQKHYNRIMLILKSILYDADHQAPKKDYNDPVISKALEYIHDHFAEEISISALAKLTNLSINQFSRRFLNLTGFTPHQYIKQYRFDVALTMLNSGVYIDKIAESCGYHSSSSFSNAFKKKYGLSPTQYVR